MRERSPASARILQLHDKRLDFGTINALASSVSQPDEVAAGQLFQEIRSLRGDIQALPERIVAAMQKRVRRTLIEWALITAAMVVLDRLLEHVWK